MGFMRTAFLCDSVVRALLCMCVWVRVCVCTCVHTRARTDLCLCFSCVYVTCSCVTFAANVVIHPSCISKREIPSKVCICFPFQVDLHSFFMAILSIVSDHFFSIFSDYIFTKVIPRHSVLRSNSKIVLKSVSAPLTLKGGVVRQHLTRNGRQQGWHVGLLQSSCGKPIATFPWPPSSLSNALAAKCLLCDVCCCQDLI